MKNRKTKIALLSLTLCALLVAVGWCAADLERESRRFAAYFE